MHNDRQEKPDLPKAVQQHVDQIVDDFPKDLVIPKHRVELGKTLQEAAVRRSRGGYHQIEPGQRMPCDGSDDAYAQATTPPGRLTCFSSAAT